MAAAKFMYCFPQPKAIRSREVVRDQITETMVTRERVDYLSGAIAMDMVLSQTQVLQTAKFDIFDIIDFRREVKACLHLDGKHELDDLYVVVTETQKKMLDAAIKAFDWTLPQRDRTGATVTTTAWIDWFELFDAFRSPKSVGPVIDPEYAVWKQERDARVIVEADARKAALDAAAEAAKSAKTEIVVPVAVEPLATVEG